MRRLAIASLVVLAGCGRSDAPPRPVASATPSVERTAVAAGGGDPHTTAHGRAPVRAGDVLDAAGAARPHPRRRRDVGAARRDRGRARARVRDPQRRPRAARGAVPGPRAPVARPGRGEGAAGGDRPARHRRERAALPGAAARDGRLGPDAADARRGHRLRARPGRGPALLQHGGHRRGHRGAADRAGRRQADARRHLLRDLHRAALRARPPRARPRPRARLRRAGRERQPALRGADEGHAANPRRAGDQGRGRGGPDAAQRP